jgi:hypothetical protein
MKHKALHRHLHTFAKAYRLASSNARALKDDPVNGMFRNNATHYKILALLWARSEKERSKALALEIVSA